MTMLENQDPPKTVRLDTYAPWQRDEGIPIYDTVFVGAMKTVALKPWARLGARSAASDEEIAHVAAARA